MFSVFDEVVGKPWKLLGAALCALTGRSNFFVARTMTLMAIAVYAVWLIIFADVLAVILLVIFWFATSQFAWKAISALEQEAKSGSDVLGRAYRNALDLGRMLTIVGTLFASLGPLLQEDWLFGYCIGAVITGGAMYIAIDRRPKKSSVLKGSIARLKKRLPRMGEQSPAPVPT
jgi:hypothetical protein